jgi:TRAP-type C4-dicarboxylate transport system permease small subunit
VLAFYSCKLAWDSLKFNDMSTGVDATPLWIPQMVMAVGTVVFAIAFIDDFILELLGKRQPLTSGEMLRNE